MNTQKKHPIQKTSEKINETAFLYRYTAFGELLTERELKIGQKVECSYYHEYPFKEEAYQRTEEEIANDEPFKPVKFGVIVGDAGVHPYWLGTDNKEQYLLVEFAEYIYPKPIPISCIKDALEVAEEIQDMLDNTETELAGEVYFSLLSRLTSAYDFLNNN